MNIKHYIFIGLSLLGFVSCSEADEVDEEWANWQSRNEAYFESQYQIHSVQTPTSFILPGWGQASSLELANVAHTNCILVDVLASGEGTESPYYTDSVKVVYNGRLMPSASYPQGYEFDRSYLNNYDPDVDVPASFSVKGIIEGFSTALQRMHRGDIWRVTIPYQLAYGRTAQDGIPAYSTLIFQIELVDFWSKKKGDRDD